ALDPGEPLVFGAGVLCGTLAPAAARVSLAAKNYATGGLGFSNAGGAFAPAMKGAGFDHLVVTGRAHSPVYLLLRDGRVSLRDADDLWGGTTWDTDRSLRRELGDGVEIASIGPAGERAVKSACIIFGRSRAAAHCGLGAVMGAKNLKAVAAVGRGAIGVADADSFVRLIDEARSRIAASAIIQEHQRIGTLCYPEPMNDMCLVNVRNWSDDHWDGTRLASLLDPYKGPVERRKLACAACPIFCSHFYDDNGVDGQRVATEGFEANAPIMFGAALDVDYAPFILQAHALCSQYGLDIDAAGSVIAFAFDCFSRGLLSTADTDGLELRWGDWRAAKVMIERLALREGIGELLGLGALEAARQIGGRAEELVAHLKGHEHFEALRAAPGWALGTAVALRGGGHLDGAPSTEFGPPWNAEACERVFGLQSAADPTTYAGKACVVSHFEKLKAATDALGLCYFTTQWYDPDLLGPDDLARLLNAATGSAVDGQELLERGDRIHNVGKAFNSLHAGFGRCDDYPADRFFSEPIASGPRAGTVIDRGKWDALLDEYYTEKGWDPVSGRQRSQRLMELGLADVAEDLRHAGMLA
ncbi:MAG TPA: aldehyde ferredoxin oxidoreductase C-terminal domain-containing protein, partial [Thermoleophilia bacterium]|nr:aldehyde ferredoxin oxidoreductase C-terminal domain-containing protein [Thermoleophilia bacterium]